MKEFDVADSLGISMDKKNEKPNEDFLFAHNNKDCRYGKVEEATGLTVIAGPCSVESEEQITNLALSLKDMGADCLRGGAFKPRTSPYDFQGLGAEGIKYLVKAKNLSGLPIVSEIVDIRDIDLFEEIDIIQIGSRNMQNYALLKELGKTKKTILLKRGNAASYEEFLKSAEYILSTGNENVILCERGIRTFERYSRNTLDITAVPAIKEMSHLPIAVDPSHAAGKASLVSPLACAAVAAGADYVMIEVHNDPDKAWTDGKQSITPEEFKTLIGKLRKIWQDMH